MKKFLACLLSFCVIFGTTIPAFATDSEKEPNIYTYPNGEQVKYYLDENEMPYTIENGEKVYLALALPHLKIIDESIIMSSNSIFSNDNSRAVPTNTYNLTGGNNNKSNVYAAFIDFTTFEGFTTPTFKYNNNHHAMRIRMSDVEKPLFGSNAVSFVYRYYYENAWYQTIIEDVVCTGASGYGFQIDCSTYPYGYVVFLIPDDIESCTVNIWTTLAY